MLAHSILRKTFQNINLLNLYFQYSELQAPQVQKPRREKPMNSKDEGEKVDSFDMRMNTVTFIIMYIHVGSVTIHIIIVFPNDKSTCYFPNSIEFCL